MYIDIYNIPHTSHTTIPAGAEIRKQLPQHGEARNPKARGRVPARRCTETEATQTRLCGGCVTNHHLRCRKKNEENNMKTL